MLSGLFSFLLALVSLLIMIILVSSVAVLARDFGIHGTTYEIVEQDILEIIKQRLLGADLKKLNQEMQEKTKKYVEKPTAVSGITKAKENKEFYFDPTYVLDHDIFSYNGDLIHRAGTVVNPLRYAGLTEDLIFIDGDDELQVKFALKIKKEKQQKLKINNLKIILVKGEPLKLQKIHKIWIYFDQAGFISNKLGIREVPALVEQEHLSLKIKIIGEKNL